MLALEEKGISFQTVTLPTGMHPFLARMRGFPGNPAPIRSVNGKTQGGLAMMDRMGTVPALRYGDRRIQTNREIVAFLDELQPDPRCIPRIRPGAPQSKTHSTGAMRRCRWLPGER